MKSSETIKRVALAVKSTRRRAGLGVREAAQQCGVSSATISRLERGAVANLPDADTLSKIAAWVGVPLSQFLEGSDAPPESNIPNTTPEIVEVHLRADKNLSPQTAKALSDMFRALYEQFTTTPPKG